MRYHQKYEKKQDTSLEYTKFIKGISLNQQNMIKNSSGINVLQILLHLPLSNRDNKVDLTLCIWHIPKITLDSKNGAFNI